MSENIIKVRLFGGVFAFKLLLIIFFNFRDKQSPKYTHKKGRKIYLFVLMLVLKID